MMRNLSRITNYYNRLEAQRDWARIAAEAEAAGHAALVKKFAPPEGAGWRKIDKRIAALRAAIQKAALDKHAGEGL